MSVQVQLVSDRGLEGHVPHEDAELAHGQAVLVVWWAWYDEEEEPPQYLNQWGVFDGVNDSVTFFNGSTWEFHRCDSDRTRVRPLLADESLRVTFNPRTL